ncbi:MAG: hypothetical protein KKH28_12975, partial [Elusimicrobia bacterium]|nr:hypothetical protein [Elusimicrobiota bacterium]
MIKKHLLAAVAFVFIFSRDLNAQNGFNLESITVNDIKNARGMEQEDLAAGLPAPEPDRVSKPDTKVEKEWTIMVFMNAKNDLAESHFLGLVGKWAEKDLKEMEKIGSTEKTNVVVELGLKGKGSKRLYVLKKKQGASARGGSQVIEEFPDADMGDYKRAIDFIKWAKTNYPAKRYFFILWNHGLGWIDPNMHKQDAITPTTPGLGDSGKGIAFDTETKNYIRTKQMGEILKQAGGVDFYASNACLMQMAEVAYEMKDYTDLIIGSEEVMLAYGFEYDKLISFMDSNPKVTAEQMSAHLINWYREFYAHGINLGPINIPLTAIGATLSTIRPRALNELPLHLSQFASAVMNNNETEAVTYAVRDVIRFILDPKNDPKKQIASYGDLYDFAKLVGERAKSPDTKQKARDLMGFISGKLVMAKIGINGDQENGYDYTQVGGIAIEVTRRAKKLPPNFDQISETKYSDLALSQASLWDEFVQWTDKVWQAAP